MKKLRIILLILVVCLTLTALCACKGAGKEFIKAQEAATEKLTALDCSAVVTDGGVVVRKYIKKFAVVYDNLAITTEDWSINTSFELEKNESFEEVPLDRSNFGVFNVKGNISDYKEEDGKATFVVAADKASNVFGYDVSAKGNISVSAEIADGVLQKMNVSFSTVSGKSVTIDYIYHI